jgi:hypothetical protein
MTEEYYKQKYLKYKRKLEALQGGGREIEWSKNFSMNDSFALDRGECSVWNIRW